MSGVHRRALHRESSSILAFSGLVGRMGMRYGRHGVRLGQAVKQVKAVLSMGPTCPLPCLALPFLVPPNPKVRGKKRGRKKQIIRYKRNNGPKQMNQD